MKKLIWIAVPAALGALAVAMPAEAAHRMMRHHHHMAMMNHSDNVTLDGKDYKVCGGAVQDDCINPRQAGLHFGNNPTNSYSYTKAEAEKPGQ